MKIYAYVILENHMHLIAQSRQLDKNIARFKSYTAKKLIHYLDKNSVTTILEQLAFYKKAHKTDRAYQRLKPVAAAQQRKSFTNSIGQEFVYIKPGTFMMGSPSNESGRYDREKQHKVTLTRGFYMQTTEVTIEQWKSFVKDTGYKSEAETGGGAYIWTGKKWQKKKGTYWNNPGFSQTNRHPVTCVSWNDAQKFIKWLNRKEGRVYRLPTEAEWEYASRAGATTPFSFGRCLSTNQANYNGNYPLGGCSKGKYREKTVSAASFSPNAWGLYDMHGNVYEWCQDWYGDYPSGSVIDPSGPSSGSIRVFRGGSPCPRFFFAPSFPRSGATSSFPRSRVGMHTTQGSYARAWEPGKKQHLKSVN